MQPINPTKDTEEDLLTARRMLDRVSKTNELQQLVEENHLERRSAQWESADECQISDFPKLDDTMLRLLTLGTYQLKNEQQLYSGICWWRLYYTVVSRE